MRLKRFQVEADADLLPIGSQRTHRCIFEWVMVGGGRIPWSDGFEAYRTEELVGVGFVPDRVMVVVRRLLAEELVLDRRDASLVFQVDVDQGVEVWYAETQYAAWFEDAEPFLKHGFEFVSFDMFDDMTRVDHVGVIVWKKAQVTNIVNVVDVVQRKCVDVDELWSADFAAPKVDENSTPRILWGGRCFHLSPETRNAFEDMVFGNQRVITALVPETGRVHR